MAENRNTINIKSDESGEIKVADEVVAIIAGLAATEVEGVSSMARRQSSTAVAASMGRILSAAIAASAKPENCGSSFRKSKLVMVEAPSMYITDNTLSIPGNGHE